MTHVARGAWSDLFRLLRADDAGLVKSLSSDFPEFAASFNDERVYGGTDSARLGQLADKAADKSLVVVQQALRAVSKILEERSVLLRRLKFTGGLISALGAGSTLGILLGSSAATLAPIISAAATLIGAVLGLYATYVDESGGSNGSVAELREKLAVHRRAVVLLQGKLQLARLQDDQTKLIDVVAELNAVAGDIEFARARLGIAA